MIVQVSESAKEAIALAYLNAQDNSGKTPEELTRIFCNALAKVSAEYEKIVAEQPEEPQKIYT